MHFSKIAVAATAAGVVSAQDPSICDKYTTALLKNNTAENQLTVITLIVKTVALGSFTGPGTKLESLPGSMVKVPGILAPATVNGVDVNLMPYFSGELASTNVGGKASSVNWLDSTDGLTTNATFAGAPGSKTNTLMTHLVEYFGAALGCSLYGQGAFPAYAGDNSQYNVHKFMALTEPEVTYFIQQVGAAAESFGVTTEDATTVGNLLNKLFNYKCSPPTTVVPAGGAQLQSICQDESCPTAPNATCPADYSAPEPSTIASLIPSSTAAAAPSSTAAAATGAVSVIPDGQPQTGPAANRTSAPAATFTGAAAATGISAALAGVAGLLAFLI